MDWKTTRDAAEEWDLTMRRVQVLCETDKVKGAVRFGRVWMIPKNAPKPSDGRAGNGRRKENKNERT